MKPSRRRDSLEKAARVAVSTFEIDQGVGIGKESFDALADVLVRFATRHGAKVRRETLKEAAGDHAYSVRCSCGERTIIILEDQPNHVTQVPCIAGGKIVERENLLSLTPRGPEKGRRK